MFGDRQLDIGNPIDVNYSNKLTGLEAIAFNTKCIASIYPDLPKMSKLVREKVRAFSEHIQNARWVIIEYYEWES
jgi:hypothetical protein